MDPLSQGVLGSSLSQSFTKNKPLFTICCIGFLSGMFPDLDVFIRSKHDPLLFLEFHRQFTHSLFFIPFGSFVFTLLFYGLFHKKINLQFKQIWFYAALGYGTHGLLDACTSYGTQLFWPFSNYRVSWNNISIIDPLFTLPILILIIISVFRKKTWYAHIAFGWAIFYLCLGFIQHHRAQIFIKELIQNRQHEAIHISVKPSFGNLILWKTIYQHNEVFYIDAINLGLKKQSFNGENIKAFNKKNYAYSDTLTDIQKKDIDRFLWFSQNYVAINPNNDKEIMDIRYSNLPNQIGGLWGIRVKPGSHEHVEFISNRDATQRDFKTFYHMIFNF